MGIQKPVSKPDSCAPSSKLDASGSSTKSTVTKKPHQRHASASLTETGSQGKFSHNPGAQLGDLGKREIKEKPHRWIESRVKRLDLAGYMEEINSLRHFGRNAGCFALQIVAIANWGWKYTDAGFKYPIPTFPHSYLPPCRNHTRGGSGPGQAGPG